MTPPDGGGPLVLRARALVTPHEVIADAALLAVGGRIAAVGPRVVVGTPRAARVVDLGDAMLAPGFVDAHVHGGGGFSVMDGPAAIRSVGRFAARHGVTSWLPTLIPTASLGELADRVREVAGLVGIPDPSGEVGATVAGVHAEGPFLSPARPGALRADWFRRPAPDDLAALIDAGGDHLRLMTLAPELPGALDLIRLLIGRGGVASIGHTAATHEQARDAFEAGATYVTHAFNAMPGLHHRAPGVIGAAIAHAAVWTELIADGVHVDPAVMRALVRAKGVDRVVAITDATNAAGLGDGRFTFDGRVIDVTRGRATLDDGTIAGSVSTMDANARILVRDVGLSSRDVIRLASFNPARAVGLGDRKGQLAVGYDADVVALDDSMNVLMTVAGGTIAYARADATAVIGAI